MEDGNALIITIKTESTVIEPFDVFEEHKYSKIMHDDLDYCSQLNHTIDIKEEDYNIETENSCLGEIEIEEDTQGATSCGLLVNKGDDDPLQCKRQIKTEKFDYDFEELEKDKFMKSENCGYSQTLVTEQNQSSTLITNQDQTQYFNLQKIKEEGFDYELAELHHSIDIKDENEKDNDDFSEMETTLQEFEFNSNIENTSANSHYQTSNEHLKIDAPGIGTMAKYLTLEQLVKIPEQKMPNPSSNNFLKQFIEIGKQHW